MIVWQYTKFDTEKNYDYIRYDDLANDNEHIQLSGNSYYDSDSDDYDDDSEPTILWEDKGGTSKIRFRFHSDGGDQDRGVSFKLSCLYPGIKA